MRDIDSIIHTVADIAVNVNELQTIEAFVALMLSATIVGIVAHKIKLPYTVSLVLVGLFLSVLEITPNVRLTHDLLMMVFLPALLFEAAIHFPASELKEYALTIATLAAPGVLLTAFGTALFGILIDNGFSIEQIALVSGSYVLIAISLLFIIKNKLNPQYL